MRHSTDMNLLALQKPCRSTKAWKHMIILNNSQWPLIACKTKFRETCLDSGFMGLFLSHMWMYCMSLVVLTTAPKPLFVKKKTQPIFKYCVPIKWCCPHQNTISAQNTTMLHSEQEVNSCLVLHQGLNFSYKLKQVNYKSSNYNPYTALIL